MANAMHEKRFVWIRTCHSNIVTDIPVAAADPARPRNIGAPTLVENVDAPICSG